MQGSENIKLTACSQIVSRGNECSSTSTSPMHDIRYLFTAVGFPPYDSGQCAFPYVRGQRKLYIYICRFHVLNIIPVWR
jgi:hypothetical protein